MYRNFLDTTLVWKDSPFLTLVSNLIVFCVYFLVFFIPLYMDPFSYDAFELPKVTIIRWVSSIILALWMLHVWGFQYGNSKAQDKERSNGFSFRGLLVSPLAVPVFYFTIILILCSIFTIDPLSSLKGTYKRQEGLFTELNYIFLFFAAAHFIRDAKTIRLCIVLSIAAGALTSLYAILQHFGIDMFSKKGMERSFSTLNHPNFLAAYLVLVMPFAFVYMMEAYLPVRVLTQTGERRENTGKGNGAGLFGTALYVTCYQLMYLALLFTYCRGAWVGHVVSLIIIILFAGRNTLMRCRLPLTVMFVSLAALTMLANNPVVHRAPFSLARRAASIVNTKDTTVVTRFIMWKSAMKVIKSHPVLGVGLDGFKAIFPQIKPEEYVKYEGLHITADKVHNETLHIAATLGLVGVFGYIWLVIMAAFVFIKLFLFESRFLPSFSAVRLSSLGIFASFAGYIAQNQFSFSVIVTGMLSFIILGLLGSCYRLAVGAELSSVTAQSASAFEKGKGKKKKEKRTREREPVMQFNYVSLPIPVLLATLISVISYRPYAADHFFLKGELYGQAGYNNEQISFFEKAVLLNPYEEQYYIKLGEAYEEKSKSEPQALQSAADAYKKASELAPLNPYNFSKMGKAYVTMAKTIDRKWYNDALNVLETAQKLDPFNPVFYNNLAAVYNDTKQPDKSIPLLEYALSLTPNYILALNNLGNALVQKKKFKEAAGYFNKAHGIEKENTTSLAGIGYCAYMQKDYCEAKKWFRKLLSISPDNKIATRFFDVIKTQKCP